MSDFFSYCKKCSKPGPCCVCGEPTKDQLTESKPKLKMNAKQSKVNVKPIKDVTREIGDVVQIKSDEWYVWTGESWREMTIEEHEAFHT